MSQRAGDVVTEQEPFSVGDAVRRPVNIYAEYGLRRRGVVTKRYAELPDYDELYEVAWHTEGGKVLDPPLVCVGYFRHGLVPL